jgi:hypothetical protein
MCGFLLKIGFKADSHSLYDDMDKNLQCIRIFVQKQNVYKFIFDDPVTTIVLGKTDILFNVNNRFRINRKYRIKINIIS